MTMIPDRQIAGHLRYDAQTRREIKFQSVQCDIFRICDHDAVFPARGIAELPDFTSFHTPIWERGVCVYLVLCDFIMCSLFDKTEMRLAGEPYTNESSFLQTLPFMVQRMSLDTVSRMCS